MQSNPAAVNKESFFNPFLVPPVWDEIKQQFIMPTPGEYEIQPTHNSSMVNGGGPHYEVPNLSSMLYEFTNKDAERILQGFRVGNFVSLRDLPTDMTQGGVLNAQKDKIQANIMAKAEAKTYVELQCGGGYFSKFEYQLDPYARFLESQCAENHERRVKQEEVHGTYSYVSTSKIPLQLKHVSPFDASSGSHPMTSFLYSDDPYESTKLEVMKYRWIEDSKILYGNFKPAHCDQSLKQVNKQHLPEVVGFIKRNLLRDWSDISFVIGTNPEDLIEMRFETESLDSPAGLHTYLNNMISCNDFVVKYQLRRVVRYWNHYSESGSQIYFMLAPPWVKISKPILYLKHI